MIAREQIQILVTTPLEDGSGEEAIFFVDDENDKLCGRIEQAGYDYEVGFFDQSDDEEVCLILEEDIVAVKAVDDYGPPTSLSHFWAKEAIRTAIQRVSDGNVGQ